MSQLPLALTLDRHARLENFVAEGNEAVVAHLRALAHGRRHDIVWIWGGQGSGKSHLLQAVCNLAGDAGSRAMYLDADAATGPDVLTGLGALDLLALDDVDRAAASPVWAEMLFGLLNEFYRGSRTLVLAASHPPSSVPFEPPDLASRAAGAVVYRLQPLSDDGRLAALMKHAEVRGLELDAATAGYLFVRVKRDMRDLCDWLDYIDRESLVAQRKITIPFVRQLLESGAR